MSVEFPEKIYVVIGRPLNNKAAAPYSRAFKTEGAALYDHARLMELKGGYDVCTYVLDMGSAQTLSYHPPQPARFETAKIEDITRWKKFVCAAFDNQIEQRAHTNIEKNLLQDVRNHVLRRMSYAALEEEWGSR